MRRFASAALVAFMILPFALLFAFVDRVALPPLEDVWNAFEFTFSQSFVSASAATIVGVFGALGLIATPAKSLKITEGILLVPQILPAIVVIVSILNFFEPMPLSWGSVVFTHTLMNVGIVAVFMARSMRTEADARWFYQAHLLGTSRMRFWFWILRRELRGEIVRCFLFVFVQCFLSFAVPLILGGFRARSFEILIYENVRQTLLWPQALGLSLLQVAVLGVFCFLQLKHIQKHQFSKREVPAEFLRSSGSVWFSILPLLASFILVTGLFTNIIDGIESFWFLTPLHDAVGTGALGTFAIAGLTGALTIGLFAWLTYLYPHERLRHFMIFYFTPGGVLTAFAFIIMGDPNYLFSMIKILLGITLVAFPILYRSWWDSAWLRLLPQVQVAKTLGATEKDIFKYITWPQLRPLAYTLGALACFWASGEFAISTMLSEGDWTLSAVVDHLLASYRINLALVVVVIMLFVGAVTSVLLWASQYVGYRKPTP